MTYQLGKKSLQELEGVDDPIVRVVKRAITITPVDFSVHDGLRTIEEQRAYVDAGVSKTMNSLHLEGKAVDLVPYINGRLRWEWPPIYQVAYAVKVAADLENVALVWGAVWDRTLEELDDDLEQEVERYVERRKRQGKKAFLDGPHIQAVKS